MKTRYSEGLPAHVEKSIRHELALIETMKYAPYFLTVYSIVRYARSQGILCQGRGSAASSAVCCVLGVTSIDMNRPGFAGGSNFQIGWSHDEQNDEQVFP